MTVAVRTWPVRPERWRGGAFRVVVIADLHACSPWMTARRIGRIVEQANGLRPDMIALLGDYVGHMLAARRLVPAAVAAELRHLSAPFGVWAVQGNHDWFDDKRAWRSGVGPTVWQAALEAAGVPVLENRTVPVDLGSWSFGLAGLGSQRAFLGNRKLAADGVDDLAAALNGADGAGFTMLLAHEPDVFADLPDHVALTLSGHTHGGQIRVLGRTPVVPSRYGSRYAYGHVVEKGRHLVVSGGLGCTGIPVRIGVPPEMTVVELDNG